MSLVSLCFAQYDSSHYLVQRKHEAVRSGEQLVCDGLLL